MIIGIDIRNVGKKRTGDEVVFFNVVKNLARIDEKNSYRLFTDISDTQVLSEIESRLGIFQKGNFKIVSLPTVNRFSWNFWTLPKYLRKNPVDVYLTQYITPFFVPKKIKIATIVHDISFNFFPQFIKWSDLFFLKTLIALSLRRADKVIGVSRFTRDEIAAYYATPKEKNVWFHNAVSEDFLSQNVSREKIEAVRKKYSLPEKYILYIGTLQPRKNIPVLVEALALLKSKKENADVKLVVAGGRGHNYDQRIDAVVEKNNLSEEVVFPGYVDENDKAALIKGAQVFCFPSLYEGFGIPILEAMSLGVPVVASDIAPHLEIAQRSAIFFDPKNPNELAEKLQKVLSDETLRSNLAKKGVSQTELFSWRKSAEKILKIFKSLEG
jgi:glycosyltransferase involved in cell wall biosynthesis